MTRARSLALLAVAVGAVSSSALLVRWADVSPTALWYWRTAGGAVALALPALGSTARPVGRQRLGVLLAGIALAAHFASWLASLELTSVAASVTLVATAPLMIAGYLAVTVRDSERRPGQRTWVALALALVGTAVITGGDAALGSEALTGDALALIGAAMFAVYFAAGDRLRATLPTSVYAGYTYAVAAVVLVPVILLSGTDLWGYDRTSWLAVGAMIAGPQLAGHTTLNLLLRELGPITVSVALLAEPFCASALFWLFFGELPPLTAVLGGPLVLAGLYLQITQSA